MRRPRRPTPAEYEATVQRLEEQNHILRVALTDTPDATHVHRSGPYTYTWRLFRATCAAGGYVTCTFHAPQQKPSVTVGLLDQMLDTWPLDTEETNVCRVFNAFTDYRWRDIEKASLRRTLGYTEAMARQLDGQEPQEEPQ